jgi:glycosyltransferase involved in cell wall biosynthesis
MKIAFVTQPWDSNLPSNGDPSGSIGILTHDLARRLAGKGHRVAVYGGAPGLSLQKRVEHMDGVEFCSVRAARVETKLFAGYQKAASKLLGAPPADRPRYASALYLAGYGQQIARAIRQRGADIIHIHNLFQLVPAVRSANPSAKIVLHMHCEWLSQIARTIIAPRLAQTDMVIGVSNHITDKVRRRFPEHAARCRTVYNGVDIDAYSAPTSHSSRASDDSKRLLFVGRISPEKGVHLLVEALARIESSCSNVTLDILGPFAPVPLNFLIGLSDDPHVASLATFYSGPQNYLDQIKAQIAAASLSNKVRLLGGRSYRETAAQYGNADIFMMASYSDAFPLPPLEAMASGLPVVAPRVGGIQEQVLDGTTGFLCDVGRPDLLADATIRLLRDDTLRTAMGAAGRRRAVDTFSWDRIIERLEDSYRELLT